MISLMRTPIIELVLLGKYGGLFRAARPALMPAMIPWAAASSYPVVPLICPAKNRLLTFSVLRSSFNYLGSTKSYSTA